MTDDIDTLNARIYHWYKEGDISERAAIDLLGEADLRTAAENERGMRRLLDNPDRYLNNE